MGRSGRWFASISLRQMLPNTKTGLLSTHLFLNYFLIIIRMGISKPKEEKIEKVEEKEEEKKVKKEKKKEKELDIKNIVRIANTDLDGNKTLLYGLPKIKGVGYSLAKAICTVLGLDYERKLNTLSEEEISKIEECLKNPKSFGIPSYFLNRRKDPYSGEDLHFIGVDLDTRIKMDIEREINLKTWRGYRHMYGQPVRGQRTRSHFRKGTTVGVTKKSQQQQQTKSWRNREKNILNHLSLGIKKDYKKKGK